MFLSNPLAPALVLMIAFASACAWTGGGEGPASASQAIEPPKSEIPFDAREPEVFQADLVTTAAGTETRVRYARKGANWRLDTFAGGSPERSMIGTEKRIHIDHRAKTYTEATSGGGPAERPAFVTDLTQSLLNQKQHAKFEKLATGGTAERYRVTVEGSTTPWIVTYDAGIKMITRQEPESPTPGGFVFEMRGFTLEVSDDLFRVPSGYRRVAWTEFAKDR